MLHDKLANGSKIIQFKIYLSVKFEEFRFKDRKVLIATHYKQSQSYFLCNYEYTFVFLGG